MDDQVDARSRGSIGSNQEPAHRSVRCHGWLASRCVTNCGARVSSPGLCPSYAPEGRETRSWGDPPSPEASLLRPVAPLGWTAPSRANPGTPSIVHLVFATPYCFGSTLRKTQAAGMFLRLGPEEE